MNAYQDQFIKPEIKVSNNVFKIILPNTNAQAELREELQYHTHIQPEDEETQIMQMIDQEKRIQRKQVQERLGISQTTSGRILKQMVKKRIDHAERQRKEHMLCEKIITRQCTRYDWTKTANAYENI